MNASQVRRAMESLPFADLDTILGGERPLILAPHADDESLGCGGLIAACCERGLPPAVVILTDGAASHPGSRQYPPARLRAVREEEARQAVSLLGLGAENLAFFAYPDTALPTDQAISERVASFAREHGCTLMLAPWVHDPHCDHEAAAIVAQEAARSAHCRVLSYPVWGWLLPQAQQLPVHAVAGFRLPIAAYLPAKHNAVAAHASQYSGLITDSPNGFRLPAALLSVFARPYEVFLTHD